MVKMSTTIQLQSSEGTLIEVELEAVKCSGLIKGMLEKMEDPQSDVVQLEKVHSYVLKMVLEWATYHKEDPAPAGNGDGGGTGAVSEWDQAFLEKLKQNPGDLFELIVAANYLDIKGLLDITTQKVAKMLKGQTVQEIREAFHVKNDFTEAEYQQIIIENEWCEQK